MASNPPVPSTTETIIQATIKIAGQLVPEAAPALAIFGLLEPSIQKLVVALINSAHKKQPTAEDFLAAAQALIDKQASP